MILVTKLVYVYVYVCANGASEAQPLPAIQLFCVAQACDFRGQWSYRFFSAIAPARRVHGSRLN